MKYVVDKNNFKKEYLRKRFYQLLPVKCKEGGCDLLYNFGFHHYLKDDKGNRSKYPLFIDCILNLDYIPNSCHTCINYKLVHYTTNQAEQIENYLLRPENNDIMIYLNYGTYNANIDIIEEKIQICKKLLEVE